MTAWIAVIAIAVAVIPAAGLAFKPPIWKEVRARPLVGAVMLAGGVVFAIAAWWLVSAFSWLLPTVAALAVIVSGILWLRSRPLWGRASGLPPGSLGIGTSIDAITHKDFYARAAGRWGPVFKMAQFHRPVVVITDLPLGLRVMAEESANLAQPRLPFGRLSPGNYIEFMNDERHARYRGILRTALSGRVVNECREGVATVVRAQLRRVSASGDATGISPDPFLEQVAFVSMLRVMCGVAVDDPRLDDVHRLFGALGTIRRFTETRPEERIEPYTRLTALVRDFGMVIRDQLARGETPERSVLSELVRTDVAHLDDDTLLGNLVLIVHVTRSNVHGLLRWTVKELLDHPECVTELRDAATRRAEGPARVEAIASHLVNEVLRLHQSEYFYREVKREIRIGEYRVPKGWLLRVGVRECHDNPAVFPEPHAFRPSRFATRQYEKTEYCPFSDGTHSCFGAGLALMIARVAASVLATEFDARVIVDGPPERDGNRHWSHWRPSRALRVHVSPRAPTAP
jgi:cytochrome P450